MNGKFLIEGKEVELPIEVGNKLQRALSALNSVRSQLLRVSGVEKSTGSGEVFDLGNFDVETERKNLLVNLQWIREAAE